MQITLNGQPVELAEPNFGKIKKIISAYNRLSKSIASNGGMDDAVVDDMGGVLALALDKTPDELDAMKFSFIELARAMPVVAELCGISFEAKSGEAPGVDSTDSTFTS